MEACDQVLVDLKICLITRYGWEEDRATAADDSLWASRSAEHERQIRACMGSRGVGTGACLQLHYKWPSRRALTLDDSIRRANVRYRVFPKGVAPDAYPKEVQEIQHPSKDPEAKVYARLPLKPITARNCPLGTSKETLSSAFTPPS